IIYEYWVSTGNLPIDLESNDSSVSIITTSLNYSYFWSLIWFFCLWFITICVVWLYSSKLMAKAHMLLYCMTFFKVDFNNMPTSSQSGITTNRTWGMDTWVGSNKVVIDIQPGIIISSQLPTIITVRIDVY